MIPSIAFLLVSLLVLIWRLWTYYDKTRPFRALPKLLSTLPLLGNFHHVAFKGRDVLTEMTNLLVKARTFDRENYCVWAGPFPIMVTTRPEDIQTIFNNSKTLGRSSEYENLKFSLGEGLMTAPVPVWKTKRRHMNKMFHPDNLEHIVTSINHNCRAVVDQLSDHVGGPPVNIFNWLYDLSLKNIMSLMFGPSVDVVMDAENLANVKEGMDLSLRLFSKRLFMPWLRSDYIFSLLYGAQIKSTLTYFKYLPDTAIKAIQKCETYFFQNDVKKIRSKDNQSTDKDGEGGIGQTTIADVYKEIRQNNPNLRYENVQFDINTLFVTGSDTVATTMSNCLLVLGQQQHIQEKLFNEVVEVLGTGDEMEVVSSEDVGKLTYMECVLNETMRMHAVVPLVARVTTGEIRLSDCTIPEGFTISVNIDGLHRNPRLYPDPDRFDPERFTAENVASRHKYAFMPFSGGPRNCIGKKYAMMFMKIAMVHLLRQYRFHSQDNLDNKYTMKGVMLRANGYPVTIEKRSKQKLP